MLVKVKYKNGNTVNYYKINHHPINALRQTNQPV